MDWVAQLSTSTFHLYPCHAQLSISAEYLDLPCFWSRLQVMWDDFLVEFSSRCPHLRCPALHYPSVTLPGPTSDVHFQPLTDARPTLARPLSTLQMARHCPVLLGTMRRGERPTRRSPGGGNDEKWTCNAGPGIGKGRQWTHPLSIFTPARYTSARLRSILALSPATTGVVG